MKKLALAALGTATLFALGACSEADTTTPAETPTEADDTIVADPGAGESVVDEDATGDDTVSISEDGVTADINDGDTSVQMDIGDDPSVTVTD